MELLVPLIVLIVALMGHLAGYAIRRGRLRDLQRSTVQKPLYNVQDAVSPAEFGCIIDGTIGYKELVAEAIQLSIQGRVMLVRQPSGKFIIRKTDKSQLGPLAELTAIQSVIMKGLDGRTGLFLLQPELDYETKQSLIRKGWIINKKPPLRGLSDIPGNYILAAVGVSLIGIMAVAIIAMALGASGIDIYTSIVLMLTVEIIAALIASLVIVFRGEMIHSASFSVAASTKYDKQWKDVYGVYEYIRISGMDVFTPNYETPNFQELDPLYPYAVAAGLDKKVLNIFA